MYTWEGQESFCDHLALPGRLLVHLPYLFRCSSNVSLGPELHVPLTSCRLVHAGLIVRHIPRQGTLSLLYLRWLDGHVHSYTVLISLRRNALYKGTTKYSNFKSYIYRLFLY